MKNGTEPEGRTRDFLNTSRTAHSIDLAGQADDMCHFTRYDWATSLENLSSGFPTR